jgi:ribosome maturation factor RimP
MAERKRGATAGSQPATGRGVRPGSQDVLRGNGSDLATLRARIRSVVEPTVSAAGLDLEDLTVTRAGRRHVVRVTVDGDGGVGHDELTDVSHDISAGLDAAEESDGEMTAGSYTLEVSSPGVDRPLILARHWRRNAGRLVKVKIGDRAVTARIMAVDDLAVTFDVEGRLQAVAFGDLGPGRVQVEFRELATETGGEGRELATETGGEGRELATETGGEGRELATETGMDGPREDADGPREQEEGA